MPKFVRFVRPLFVGDERELVLKAIAAVARPERAMDTFMHAIVMRYQDRDAWLHNIGDLVRQPGNHSVILPLKDFIGVHRWTRGVTNSGKSVQVLSEKLQLIQPTMNWGSVARRREERIGQLAH